ncbi:hypothetical protein V6N11_079262 [Hibiscus sabdariffa]|uniref:F-box associated beta-propeller type 3 domain-containing protein n=1 Tax=Hibiscus sabdariffa TaxID=183260 RepID=A0ABR2RV20_9ROSI
MKSLVKFRSVSKTWNSLICNPSFILTHLQSSLSNKTTLLLIRGNKNDKLNYCLHYDNDGFDNFKQLRFPHFDLKFVLWNPSIQRYISLPPVTRIEFMVYNVGFGFDSRTNDYKLVVAGVDKGDSWIQPYLFSLNENCWKRVTTTLPTNFSHLSARSWIAPFVNGVVHWLGYQKRNSGECSYAILGFNLSAEGFFHINLPESFTGHGDLSSRIMGYGESCIAVFRNFRELRELWVMKEYGVVEYWTKVLTLHGFKPGLCVLLVVGFRKNGQVLLQVHNVKMVLLDLNTQQMDASLNLNCQQFDFHGCSKHANYTSSSMPIL